MSLPVVSDVYSKKSYVYKKKGVCITKKGCLLVVWGRFGADVVVWGRYRETSPWALAPFNKA